MKPANLLLLMLLSFWVVNGYAAGAVNSCGSVFIEQSNNTDFLIEKQLAEGTVVFQRPVGQGLFRARFVEYSNGLEGVWKSAVKFGDIDTANAEVAAYKIDNYLGLNSVPVTVIRTLDGVIGSVQYRVRAVRDHVGYIRDPAQTGLLDYLIGNPDRHGENFLQRNDGKLIAIDHGLSFKRVSEHSFNVFQGNLQALEQNLLAQQRIQGEFGLATLKKEASQLQSEINAFSPSKEVVDKLRATTEEDWKRVVGDNINIDLINSMMERQTILIQAFDKAEQLIGVERLYPAGPVSPLLKTGEGVANGVN
ncbi:hypothetical protein ACLVWU_11130 [Bdellovibrio sp. HCB290]|uniref:hypothetical protein n=1 Tax=Bdellovibrio sp. HCB290 TaxID=3394356 RepID=UPI0039B4EA47